MNLGLALLERTQGDVVLSPYGLARALWVIREGATGETRRALDAVLEQPVPSVDGVLSAQAVWLHADYAPGPALAGIDNGPLDVDRINAWCSEKTRGMIPRVIDALSGDEVFALTDAEYLDAKWQWPFGSTSPAPFEGVGDVPMMWLSGTFEHAGNEAVRLPYVEGDLRFVAMLGEWRELDWQRGHGSVQLPRFSTTTSLDLGDLLVELGLGPAFAPGSDLDSLIVGPGAKALSRILQRARVDVDEEGTRAAAVTAVTATAVAYVANVFDIVFDRPFTWAVEHAPTGTLVFMGRVLNPIERSA